MPFGQEFPANKTLLKILKQKPTEVKRSNAIEGLKSKLNEVFIRVFELKTSLANKGADKLMEYCLEARTDVHMETEKRIEMIRAMGDRLIKRIDDYEAECVASLAGSNISRSEIVSAELMELFREFDLKCRGYLQRSLIDESMVEDAVRSLDALEKRTRLEAGKVERIVFNGKRLEFVRSAEEKIDELVGKIVILEVDDGIKRDLENLRAVMTLSGR
jgi:hypothetical protein